MTFDPAAHLPIRWDQSEPDEPDNEYDYTED